MKVLARIAYILAVLMLVSVSFLGGAILQKDGHLEGVWGSLRSLRDGLAGPQHDPGQALAEVNSVATLAADLARAEAERVRAEAERAREEAERAAALEAERAREEAERDRRASLAWDALLRQFRSDFGGLYYSDVLANLAIAGIPAGFSQNPRSGAYGATVSERDAVAWARRWMKAEYSQALVETMQGRTLWMESWTVEVFR